MATIRLLALSIFLLDPIAQDDQAWRAAVDRMVAAVNDGKARELHAALSDDARKELDLAGIEAACRSIAAACGRLEAPRFVRKEGAGQVWRADGKKRACLLTVVLDPEGRIAGLQFKPEETAAPGPAKPVPRNRVVYRLPFDGEWFVFWGGDTPDVNKHVTHPAQRRAFDIVKVDSLGRSHSGDGRRNEDYFCFGQPVLAPADGEVVEAVDGVPDNPPGEMNTYHVPGNTVVLRHADGEFSFLAHFQRGTVRVRLGERVKRGQELGLCGNSGNSSEPHLHFHVMDAVSMIHGKGIKVHFQAVQRTANGRAESLTDYSPVKGDRIAPP